MKVATAPYKNADFDYPEVQLLDVKAKAAPKAEEKEVPEQTDAPQENQPQENVQEPKPAKTPADIIKNFKQNQEAKNKQEEQAPVPPATQQTPPAQPIQQVQTAPVPIPMAVPESLH